MNNNNNSNSPNSMGIAICNQCSCDKRETCKRYDHEDLAVVNFGNICNETSNYEYFIPKKD